mmetsp:Transcript_19977/g.30651  ORF Transcript_19977/g.30651 Transcript_19977/m.30651 type:complete len:106 (-) Transcript_19977:431-748(-)
MPSSVSVRIRNIIGPFVICPIRNVILSTFRMAPNPFGFESSTISPVSCGDDDISINGIIDGMEVVVVPFVVDPFDKGLIIACMESWNSWRAPNEIIKALEEDCDG